ncbi:MAG: precorrin-3B C(17)-methyltransferase [Alphaproteobacteria bacterium]
MSANLPAPAVIVLGPSGSETARRVMAVFPGAELHGFAKRVTEADVRFDDTAQHLEALFLAGRPIIALAAAGIVIRCLAPHLGDKRTEPPVIALTEDGSHAVPLLGGHRGANRMATQLSEALGGTAAITTAGELSLGFALDDPPAGWRVEPGAGVKKVTAALLAGEAVALDDSGELADWLHDGAARFETGAALKVAVSDMADVQADIVLHPQSLAVGIGCERGADAEEVAALLSQVLGSAGLSPLSIACLASIDVKMGEPAVRALARQMNLPLRFFDAARLERETPRLANPSPAVFRAVGCHGVAEAAALACAGPEGKLIAAKTKSSRATCAIAQAGAIIHPHALGRGLGRLTIVGLGPGDADWRTPAASAALARASDVVGFRDYLDLAGPLAEGTERHAFAIGEEEARVRVALDLAAEGREVALVSSGDAGIYGMAALAYELLEREAAADWRGVEIGVEPGVSALQAAAARAGAPLGHDFCAISLSDLMTPWAVIEDRLRAAAAADFVVALYNPASKRRREGLTRAMEIFAAARPVDCPVIVARNLGRAEETVRMVALGDFDPDVVDMLTLVMVGGRETRLIETGDGPRIYTPRGYGPPAENKSKRTAP